jgi:hypothetical protein
MRRMGSRSFALLFLATLLAGCAGRPPAPDQVSSAMPLPAQAPTTSPWAEADRRGAEAPDDAARSVGSLAHYLTEGLPTEEMRVRAIFRWMTAHIRYDLQGLRSADYGDLSPEAVLERRSAVCEGYSGLFESLVRAAGFEVVMVSGFAKGVGYSAGAPLTTSLHHAWNAVKVRGEWKLLDCTWGAGALNERGEYVPAFDPFYFFTPPEQFIYSHFPNDSRWQLLAEPLTREAFEALALLKPAFFTCGLGSDRLLEGHLREEGPEVVLPIRVPDGVSVKASVLRGEEPVGDGYSEVHQGPSGREVRVLLPAPGTYTVRLFAASGAAASLLDWAADLLVTASTGSGGKTFEQMKAPGSPKGGRKPKVPAAGSTG